MTEPTLNPESGFRRLRIQLAYDGTNFAGWAKQPDQRTLQEELESAISLIVRAKADSIVAGRTDAGVHATHQIIHVDVPEAELDIENFAYRLNRILDEDLRMIVYSELRSFNNKLVDLTQKLDHTDNDYLKKDVKKYNV